MTEKEKTSDAVRILNKTFVKGSRRRRRSIDKERKKLEVAQQIYDLRTRAGLSQTELADKVGTTQSAICRLEAADYERQSITMLKRIAKAMNYRVEVRLVPDDARLTLAT